MTDEQPSLAAIFFEQARQTYLGEEPRSPLPFGQLVQLCSDVSLQLELTRLVQAQNDPHFRAFLASFLEQAAEAIEEAGEKIEDGLELLDRAAIAPTATVSAGAIAAIVATGGAAAPVLVLVAGVAGLAGLGVLRTSQRAKAREQKKAARRVRALGMKLGAIQ